MRLEYFKCYRIIKELLGVLASSEWTASCSTVQQVKESSW